jgi:hypothetical protein
MKMKRFVCIMVLVCLVFSVAFAQQKAAASAAKKNAIGLDIFDLLEGVISSDSDNDITIFVLSVGYEALIVPHFSIGADATAQFIKYKVGNDTKDDLYLRIAAEGRYYTMSTGLDKFFLGTTVGFVSYSRDGSTSTKKGGYQGLSTSLKVGYKLILSGLYLEPSMSYVFEENYTDQRWEGGLRLGILF